MIEWEGENIVLVKTETGLVNEGIDLHAVYRYDLKSKVPNSKVLISWFSTKIETGVLNA
jgi:hypothetical protein